MYPDGFIANSVTLNTAAPNKNALFHRNYFHCCAVAIVAADVTAGIGIIGVIIAHSSLHSYNAFLLVLDTEIG